MRGGGVRVNRLIVMAAGILVAGCSAGGNDEEPSLPLPATAPSVSGTADGPALEPKVLVTSTDDLETMVGGDDSVRADRRAGGFVNGGTVVGYSIDDISGYDLESGERVWTSDLDMGGGAICSVSQPDRKVKTFVAVFSSGDSDLCSGIATISVADGSVVNQSNHYDPNSFGGPDLPTSIDTMFTYHGVDYGIESERTLWNLSADPVEKVMSFDRGTRYRDFLMVPGSSLLIASSSGRTGRCAVDAFRLPSFEPAWSTPWADLFPDLKDNRDCNLTPARGNPLWVFTDSNPEDYTYLVQLDPKTGTVIDREQRTADDAATSPSFDISQAYYDADSTVGLKGGDLLITQRDSVARRSMKDSSRNWLTGLSFRLHEDDQTSIDRHTVLSDVTADGRYVVGTVSDEITVELFALDVKSGKLVGRWPLPEKYRNGFQVQPHLTLFDGGVVLTRNFERWRLAYDDRTPEPDGDRYDIGVFTFPDPDQESG